MMRTKLLLCLVLLGEALPHHPFINNGYERVHSLPVAHEVSFLQLSAKGPGSTLCTCRLDGDDETGSAVSDVLDATTAKFRQQQHSTFYPSFYTTDAVLSPN